MNAIEQVIAEWRLCPRCKRYAAEAERVGMNSVAATHFECADELERLNREVIEPGFEKQLFAARLDECKAAQLAWNVSRGYCGDYFKDRIAELERNLKELGE